MTPICFSCKTQPLKELMRKFGIKNANYLGKVFSQVTIIGVAGDNSEEAGETHIAAKGINAIDMMNELDGRLLRS